MTQAMGHYNEAEPLLLTPSPDEEISIARCAELIADAYELRTALEVRPRSHSYLS